MRAAVRNITMTVGAGDVVAITGRNGSGKSTLIRMLADVLSPTDGEISWKLGDQLIERGNLRKHIGFIAPYLHLYTEFSAWEHVEMVQDLRGLDFDKARGIELFTFFGLLQRKDDRLSDYSSGMLQRVRYVCGLIHCPSFLILDEPTTNLDSTGIKAVHSHIRQEASTRVTVIATNDLEDLTLCNKRLELWV